MSILSEDEIDKLLSQVGNEPMPGADRKDRVEQRQRKGFERLFVFRAKTGPYSSNLEYLEDEIRYHAQLLVIQRAQIRAATSEESYEAYAHDFLFYHPRYIPLARQINRKLRKRIQERLAVSAFTPGFQEIVRREKLSKRDAEILMTLFMMKLERRELKLDQLAEIYTSNFRERIEFYRYMRSDASPIGKRLLFLKRDYGDNQYLQIHGDVFNMMLGMSLLEEEYMAYGILSSRNIEWDKVVLPEEVKQRVYSLVYHHAITRKRLSEWGYDRAAAYGLATTILFQGKSGTGKTMFAHALASRIGKKVITADVNEVLDRSDSASALRSLLLQARLQDAILFLDECERLLGNPEYRSAKVTDVLKAFEEFDGIIIMATNMVDKMDPAMRRRILYTVNFDVPTVASREQIWRAHITEKTRLEGAVDLRYLAEKYELTGGLIKNAVLLAAAAAVERNPEQPALRQSDLERAAEQVRRDGQEIFEEESVSYHDKYDLRSLIYADDVNKQIAAIVTACRRRQEIWREWGFAEKFARGSGICALFNGPSGTGKTAAVYAIAAELGLPVRTIEFATLQSKWFGDTERNVLRLFSKIRPKEEVVFLDECDSLLTSRTAQESQVRSNVVNIFLRQLEVFDGILFMTTNLKEELDPALERRLLFRVDFTMPDASMRERIWRSNLPAKAPVDRDIDWVQLAREYEFTGGQIRNAILSAMYAALAEGAESISADHLRQACEQQKNGFERRKKIGFSAA
jgi:SpoVK/Ycf46/Vps4 family AAA+-type ATPase